MIHFDLKKRLMIFVVPAIFAGMTVIFSGTVFSADSDNEKPTFTSPAEVTRAEQLSAKAAATPSPEIIAAINANKKADRALEAASRTGDKQAIAAAKESYRATEKATQAVMARACGVTVSDISSMRGQRMSWGGIARAMGVNPGLLGMSHSKGNFSHNNNEMMETTYRDIQHGQSMSRGAHSGDVSGSHSMGMNSHGMGMGSQSMGSHGSGMSGHGGSGIGGAGGTGGDGGDCGGDGAGGGGGGGGGC